MQIKRTVTILTLLTALIFCSSLLAQKKSDSRSNQEKSSQPEQQRAFEGWTEDEAYSLIQNGISSSITKSEYYALCSNLHYFSEFAARINSKKIAQLILDIPENSNELKRSKVNSLYHLKEFSNVHEYVIQSLDDESPAVQVAAASVLLAWGEEWELAAPIICQHEEYYWFQKYKDKRAIHLLYDAVKNGSWKGRIYAAAALYYTYGDSIWYPKVALDVILNAPINTDNEDINWAKYHALSLVPEFNLESSLPGLCRLAYDNGLGIGTMAVEYLTHLSEEGYQEATQTLLEIKDNHPDANIREQTKMWHLEQEQE